VATLVKHNIFYPKLESTTSEISNNPQGSGTLFTGVVKRNNITYVVLQNMGTGEASILRQSDASGSGQIVGIGDDYIRLSTAAGILKVKIGDYLSGANEPGLPLADGTARQAQRTGSQPPLLPTMSRVRRMGGNRPNRSQSN
jgi:hypothetical protein